MKTYHFLRSKENGGGQKVYGSFRPPYLSYTYILLFFFPRIHSVWKLRFIHIYIYLRAFLPDVIHRQTGRHISHTTHTHAKHAQPCPPLACTLCLSCSVSYVWAPLCLCLCSSLFMSVLLCVYVGAPLCPMSELLCVYVCAPLCLCLCSSVSYVCAPLCVCLCSSLFMSVLLWCPTVLPYT
jgi:hypothetical protein